MLEVNKTGFVRRIYRGRSGRPGLPRRRGPRYITLPRIFTPETYGRRMRLRQFGEVVAVAKRFPVGVSGGARQIRKTHLAPKLVAVSTDNGWVQVHSRLAQMGGKDPRLVLFQVVMDHRTHGLGPPSPSARQGIRLVASTPNGTW